MDEIDRIKEKCIERVLDCRYEDDKVGIYIARAIQDATQHEKQRTKEVCKEKIDTEIIRCTGEINSIYVLNKHIYRDRIKLLEWCKKYAIDEAKGE